MAKEKLENAKAMRGARTVKAQRDIEIGSPLVVRVLINERVTYPNHWVSLVEGKNASPIPCATTGCSEITLPDGSILHSYPAKTMARFAIFDWEDNRPVIFECGSLIHDEILRYHQSSEWGDLTKYDLRIQAVAQPGPFKKTYKVEPIPPEKSRVFTAAQKAAIKAAWADLQEQWEPDRSPETIRQLIGALTTGKDSDEDEAAELGNKFPGVHAGTPFGDNGNDEPAANAKSEPEDDISDLFKDD